MKAILKTLFSVLLLALGLVAGSAQVTVDSIVDPETFPVPASVSDSNVRMLSKYGGTWLMVKPSQLQTDVDPSWGVISLDSTGNVTWLGTVKPSNDGEFIAITDFEGDRIFLPTLAKVDSAYVSATISNDTITLTNHAGTETIIVLPAASGSGEANVGFNTGGGSEVYKTKTDSALIFRTLDVSGTLINITQTDTTLVFSGVEDDNQTIDSLALNGSVLTISLEGDGEAPITVDLASLTAAGTDNQTVDTLSYAGGIITLTLRDDGEAPYTVDISGVDTDTQLSEEQVEDFIGNMLSGNTETLITVTYQDADGTIDFVVENDLSLYDNSTSDFTTNTILQDTAAAIRGDMVRNFDDLLDVTITTPLDSTLVFYDSLNGIWINGPTIDEIRGSGGGTDTSGYNTNFTISNDTIYITDGDGTLFAVLPSGIIDTDNQTVDSLILSGNTLILALEDDGEAPYTLDLSPINTDNQTIDTLSLSGTTLTITLEDDGEAPYTVDLAGLQDGTGTDDQTASEVNITDAGGYYTGTEVETALQEIGADIASLTAGGIPTRYDYADLRTNPPTDSLVFITAANYRGLFQRVTSGTEDSGVTILDDNSDYWSRVRDPGYFNMNWYEIGGPTGAAGLDAVDSYSDVLNSICNLSGGGVTVDFSGEDSPKLFLLDKRVDLAPYMTFIGRGDTLRRQDAFFTTITADSTSTDGGISVADTSNFRVGQRVTVTGYRSHAGVRISNKRILSKGAGYLDLEGQIGGDVFIGDTVFLSFPMFRNGGAFNLGDIVFDGIVFDGNWRNNPYTNSWSLNNTINLSNNSGSHLSVNNCKFYDLPTENMIAASATITNCEATQTAGSFYHISVVPDTALNVYIENCWTYNTNIATTDSTDHSEAVIVSSATPSNVKVRNSQFRLSAEPLIGDFGGGTDFWELINVRAENIDGVSLGGYGSEYVEGLKVENCHFTNCGRLKVTNGDLLLNQILIDPIITGNTFINTAVHIEGSRNLRFENNQMLYEPSEGGFSNATDLPYLEAMCYFSEFTNLQFRNNTLRSDTVLLADTLRFGVIFDNTGVIDNGISTQYYLGYGLDCSDNRIQFFQRGITCDTAITADPASGDNRRTRAYHDWHINDNEVWMLQKGVANSWGILIGPGMEANRNTVYSTNDTLVTTIYPMFGYGIDDQSFANTSLPGCRMLHNRVVGIWDFSQSIHSIFVGGNTSTDQGGFNCEVKYNLTPTPISGGGATQSPAISRILYNDLISDEIPDMTTPAMPPELNFEY